ncbi:MAG: ABC transporter permease [Acidobacteria bacterium]|nr:ABC transporter permease [Acidobacteriota bacterium]MCW5969092.1 ABC transporter permease [Blastocatellales bacterium]
MIETGSGKLSRVSLRYSSTLIFLAVPAIFSLLSPRFLAVNNLVNILIQSASTAIVATGMTFVLLTAGIDLSVGSVMFVSAVLAGKLALNGQPLWLATAAILLVGMLYGAFNAICVARLRIIPFIATLATLYFGRGLGLWLTETRAMNLPESILRIGSASIAGIPFPVWTLAFVVGVAHLILTRTSFGRQIYAMGNDADAARKAGVRTDRIKFAVYVISGFCAALGGLVSIAQLGAVSPTFGNQREFAAISAAVLGGVSLFGGRGAVLPGVLLGALLIQTIENGLVIANADPYIYPLVMSLIIFLAVMLDSLRNRMLRRSQPRIIRPFHE